MNRVYALVDCNSFFCSCERVIRPHLRDKPVVVLSNNDGCVVSLTPEAKKLGIKMGDVYFKIKDLCNFHGVHAFSSSFRLYGSMSDRVMKIIATHVPKLEVYSIDEAFLVFEGFDYYDLVEYCKSMRAEILKQTSIPVSIGIAPNKVLAKLANNWAKKNPEYEGVVDVRNVKFRDEVMSKFDVEDIWGIGRQTAKKIRGMGMKTALDLRDYQNDQAIQKYLHKPGRQIQDELRGEVCFSLSESAPKKSILVSRSFDHQVKDKREIEEALVRHTTHAARKLREEGQVCRTMTIYMRTNPFRETPQYQKSAYFRFVSSTNDTGELVTAAMQLMNEIYLEGYEYKKCGVCLYDFEPEDQRQLDLFSKSHEKSEVMKLMDDIHLLMLSGKSKLKKPPTPEAS